MARELWLSKEKERWTAALDMYDEAIAALAKEKKKPGLVALDTFWREELPACLKEREAKGGAYLTLKELERVMEWKLTRGKFRPLMGRIKANDKHKVEECSRRAFALLANTTQQDEGALRGSLEAVSELGGVGPATASAILAAYRPSVVCFMEDACMAALWPDKPMAYTLPQYVRLQAALIDKSKQLGGALGAEGVGRALWAAQMAHKLGLAGSPDKKAGASSSKASKDAAKANKGEEDGSNEDAEQGRKKKKAAKKHKQDDDDEKEKGAEKPKRQRK